MFKSHRKYTSLVATVAGCLAAAGTAFAQAQPATPDQQTAQGYSSSPTQLAATTPSKSETAPSAFEKLDASHSGFVTKEQAAKLDGFDKAFTQADKNKDGKLSQDEFNAAWAIYTGKPQG
jgi:Ca2+-binding EF-hand superfamily protein